jgi:hypothetical protein
VRDVPDPIGDEPGDEPPGAHDARVAWADWAREFIYGSLAVVIVIAGVQSDADHGEAPRAAAIVLVGGLATWAAHVFSSIIGQQLAHRRTSTGAEIRHAMGHAWPIVVAAFPAVAAMAGATLELWTLATAVTISNVTAVVVLGAAGLVAARATGAGPLRTVVFGLITASIGLAIVAVELALHH